MAVSPSTRKQNLLLREVRRRRVRQGRRQYVLFAAALVGVLVGIAAILFQISVHWVAASARETAAWLTEDRHGGWVALSLFGVLVGGFAGWIIDRFCPEAAGSGIPHVKAVLMNVRRLRGLLVIPVKIVGNLLSMLAGMSLGREGPTVQIGASIGQLTARFGKAPRRTHAALIASGAGAGLAAAFNAPLAGFLFVMEELKREMSPLIYAGALVASLAAVAVTRVIFDQGVSFPLVDSSHVPLKAFPAVILLGVVAALVGVLFNKATLGSLFLRERLKMPRWMAGAMVGAIASICLSLIPEATGGGHRVASLVLSGGMDAKLTLGFVVILFCAKLALTSLSFGTGLPGGIFAPIMVIGALMGYFLGTLFGQWFPGLGVSPHVFATIGMAALLASSQRAPLMAIALIVEMTQQYALLYALALAVFVSHLVADLLRDQPIYDALLERDLRHVEDLDLLPESAVQIELIVESDSPMDGRRLKDVNIPVGALVVNLERNGGVIMPSGASRIRAGDKITLLVTGRPTSETIDDLHDLTRAS